MTVPCGTVEGTGVGAPDGGLKGATGGTARLHLLRSGPRIFLPNLGHPATLDAEQSSENRQLQEWILIFSVWVDGDFRDMTRVAQFQEYATCKIEGDALQLDFMERAAFVKTAQLLDQGETPDKDAIRARTVALYDCIRVPSAGLCSDDKCAEDAGRQSTTRERISERVRSDSPETD